MHKTYRELPGKGGGRAVAAANAAIIFIIAMIAVCIVEMIILAAVNAKVKAQGGGDEPAVVTGDTPATSAPGIDTDPPVTSASTPVNAQPNAAYLAETEDYGQEYIDKIIFVGDSTTYGLKAYAMLNGGKSTKQVWTPASGTYSLNQMVTTYKIVYPQTGEELTVADAAARAKPEYMVVTLGVNYGVPYCGETEFKKYYRMLLDAITAASPSTKLILQSIYPVATNNELKDITNEKIDLANSWIADLALEYGLKYLHTNPTLKDTDGYLFYSYQNGDGLHLKENGFEAVLKFIRTHGYPKS